MPRPANPRIRAALLDAGERLMHERGFHGTGVKDITDAASVPKGSFYSYFDSKEALVVAVVEQYWTDVEERYGRWLTDATLPPLERVATFFRAMTEDNAVRQFTLGCLLGNVALELSDTSTVTRAKLTELFSRWEERLAATLREAQVAGEVATERDVRELAATLIESWEGAVMRGKVEQSRAAYERFERVVLPRLAA